MKLKLFDSERKVLDVLWRMGDLSAKSIADILGEEIGWNKNTTYTVIKKCIEKGAVERQEPGFICHPLITKEAVQSQEIDELVDKVFDGSPDHLFAALLDKKKLPNDVVQRLTQMIQDAEG